MTRATLANWRTPPHSTWAFRHVEELLPTAAITHGSPSPLLAGDILDVHKLSVRFENRAWSFDEVIRETDSDGILVLQDGKVVHQSYCRGDGTTRHILFSVSKSITALLAGILVERGRLDPEAPVTHYVPEVAASAYGSAGVRHILDMTVDLVFVEDYLAAEGDFARYRVATGWNPPNPKFGSLGLHEFLATLPRGNHEHGKAFHYVSPNSDLLGWILERAGGESFVSQVSRLIWRPLGAEYDAYITVDGHGAPRTAGGICTTLPDLARLAEMVRCGGLANGQRIVPQDWIDDIWESGDRAAWQLGSMVELFPEGRYRSQWYISTEHDPALCAIGIHGQWIYIKPNTKTVIVKQSAQREPLDNRMDLLNFALFEEIAAAYK